MSYGYNYYNTAGVTMRDSFAEYVDKFKGTHPIRSKKNANVIPLGKRNKHSMASISMPDADTICLNFYGHPLVTWKSDDSFEVFPPRYYSPYAVANIQQFLPAKIEFDWNRGRVVVKHNGNSYLLGQDKTIKFKKVGPEAYELVAACSEYAIKKKRGSEKKFVKECKPFLDWMELVQSIDNQNANPEKEMEEAMDTMLVELGLLTNIEFDKWCQTAEGQRNPDRWEQSRLRKHVPHAVKGLWRATNGFHTDGCKLILNWITEPMSDKWVTALYIMMFNVGERGYDRPNHKWGIKLTRDLAERYIEELVKHVHFEHCFNKVPLGAGEIPTKQNVEYETTYSLTL